MTRTYVSCAESGCKSGHWAAARTARPPRCGPDSESREDFRVKRDSAGSGQPGLYEIQQTSAAKSSHREGGRAPRGARLDVYIRSCGL